MVLKDNQEERRHFGEFFLLDGGTQDRGIHDNPSQQDLSLKPEDPKARKRVPAKTFETHT